MPTVIERISRRGLLGAAAGTALPAWPATTGSTLFAAWDDGAAHHVGVLRTDQASVQVRRALALPTRAHGLAQEPEGTLLAVARRPGDWLLRWHPARHKMQWYWHAGGRSFNGHVERRGNFVFTTETDHASGHGVIVQRSASTLRERAVWPTHGRDPHDFVFDDDGALWVANGGIGTDAATGRAKDVRAMDASLVRLDARSGALTGQWRLADARLSVRHLALASDGRLGIALQAEHDNAAERERAPLLALCHNGQLRTENGPAAAGYAGDTVALGQRFFVSATRTGKLLTWDADGICTELASAPGICALAATQQQLWCGAADGVLSIKDGILFAHQPRALRLDNHAIALASV